MAATPYPLTKSTTVWTEAAVIGTASLMLTRHCSPERVLAFLTRMAQQLP